jgi:hypothetical protein
MFNPNKSGEEMLSNLSVIDSYLSLGLTEDATGVLEEKKSELQKTIARAASFALFIEIETGVKFPNPYSPADDATPIRNLDTRAVRVLDTRRNRDDRIPPGETCFEGFSVTNQVPQSANPNFGLSE